MSQPKTAQQLQDQILIINILSNAGWIRTIRSEVFEVAELEYHSETLNIEIGHEYKDNAISIAILSEFGELYLLIDYQENLQELLKTIITFQDSISPHNYQEYIRKILKICPSTFVDTEDDLIPLIDDEVDKL